MGGSSPVLLPEVGRAVRSRSKSENSSGSASKPPTTAGGRVAQLPQGPRGRDAPRPRAWTPTPGPHPRARPVPVVPLVLGLAGDPPQGSEKAGAGAQGSEAGGPPTGAPPG